MTCDEARALLDADLDRELEPVRSAELGRHLAQCAACRARAAALAALRDAIRSKVEQPEPSELLLARLERALPKRRRAIPVAPIALAATLLIAFAGWLAVPRRGLDASLLDAHVRALQVEHLTDVASSDRHTVKPWFQGKIDYAFPVFDFAPQGFPLVGGRLDVIGGKNTAVLVYKRRLHVLDVFVFAGPRPSGARVERGFHVLGWSQGGTQYEAISDAAPEELESLRALIDGAK